MLHKMKYRKKWKMGILFDFFSERTLFYFPFVFAKLTISSLIYYMLIQDNNFNQSTLAFGFCIIPNCMRLIIHFLKFCIWKLFFVCFVTNSLNASSVKEVSQTLTTSFGEMLKCMLVSSEHVHADNGQVIQNMIFCFSNCSSKCMSKSSFISITEIQNSNKKLIICNR